METRQRREPRTSATSPAEREATATIPSQLTSPDGGDVLDGRPPFFRLAGTERDLEEEEGGTAVTNPIAANLTRMGEVSLGRADRSRFRKARGVPFDVECSEVALNLLLKSLRNAVECEDD